MKRKISFEVDERLFRHFEGLRKAQEVLSGEVITRSEFLRRLLIRQSKFSNVELTIKDIDPLIGTILKEEAGH